MAPDMETMDRGEKREGEGNPSVVDDKAEDVVEVDAENLEENEKIEEPGDETEEELEEGNAEDRDEGKETEDKIIEKKGTKREKETESGELKTPRTSASERPTRERKAVERFNVGETPKSSASKTLIIEKGRGTQLKDIPNVAFKLSKRKADENLQLLHSLLFGKKAKVHTLKKNIGLFSGFIWAENEEKHKLKVKEKIDKCVKEKLLDFCDVLNISVNKTSAKKEELVAKLVEFLASPHATTDSLLADKEKGKKRKSKSSAIKGSNSSHVTAGRSTKKQKLDSEPGKKQKSSIEEEDDSKSQPPHGEDDDNTVPEAESEHEKDGIEDKTNDDEPKEQKLIEKVSTKKSTSNSGVKSKSANKRSTAKAPKSAGKSTSPVLKKCAEAESKHNVKAALTKKKKVDKEIEKDTKGTSSSRKSNSSAPAKASEMDEDDSESSEENDVKEPTREEMRCAVVDMLKESDFNKTTLSDILKQLGNHFELDLTDRKSEVKDIITEVIESMSDDEDDSGDEEDEA